MLDERLSSAQLLLVELFLFQRVLVLLQLLLYLSVFFFLVDLFEILVV